MRRRLVLLALLALLAAAALAARTGSSTAAPSARGGSGLLLGLMDDGLLDGQTDVAFSAISQLRPGVIRYDVDWPRVARRRPQEPRNPDDRAYDFRKTDEIVRRADALGIPVVISIVHTPQWAGGTRKHNHKPRRLADLQNFAYAVATRYSGTFIPRDADEELPLVKRWTAWNEPNTQTHLAPQYVCRGGKGFHCKGGRFIAVSPAAYVGILGAIYRGIHAAASDAGVSAIVAGGVTKPTGGGPTAFEPSIAPLKFVRLMAARHAKFDVYAHHPYRTTRDFARSRGDNVGFDALGKLTATLDRLYRGKRFRLWLTEYGVQTNPPDAFMGVSLTRQAALLREGVNVARRNRRVDMLIWFLIRDEAVAGRRLAGGFQTGLARVNGAKKPSWSMFRSLAS